jgi:hypothetical protein
MKTFKDVTNLFFAVKKHIDLKKHEHSLKECLSNKLAMIHRAAASIIDSFFAPMEQKRKPLVAASAFDAYF